MVTFDNVKYCLISKSSFYIFASQLEKLRPKRGEWKPSEDFSYKR